jgi:hypothetical protein
MFITTKLLDFVHRPDFHKPENTTFRKLDLFPSSGEGGGHLLYKKKTPKACLSTGDARTKEGWTKSRSLVVMSVTHHRQNPLECISHVVACIRCRRRLTTVGIHRSDHATPLYPQKLAVNFVDKWQSLSRYSSLAD